MTYYCVCFEIPSIIIISIILGRFMSNTETNKFIKTGILPKKTKEVESSLPQEAIAKKEA